MLAIWNPNAGKTSAARNVLSRLEQIPEAKIVRTKSSAHAAQVVRNGLEDQIQRVVVAGGDGTINAVINGYMQVPFDFRVPLGVIPLGTANDWCSSLAVPEEEDAALDLLKSSQSVLIDVIAAKTATAVLHFANIATGGNSHRVTESITSEQKQMWGALCYLRGSLGILADLDSFQTRIAFNGGQEELFDTWNIIVANGRTSAGKLAVAPRAELNDGLLDVVIIKAGTLLDIAAISIQYAADAYAEAEQIEYRKAKWIRIRSEPPLHFSIDGDLLENQPIEFHIVPAALPVIVGETACIQQSIATP
ncbi:MAG: diacylglycerol kinase family lipid kinase [Planctomycetales bacterium]|nr:diacylglycerol kinase family lipid kinase [Planctomycetales bacterium]